MKKKGILLVTLLAAAVLCGSAQAKTYPAGGSVTGLKVSPDTANAGDAVTFTVSGTGKCGFTIYGFPSQGMNDIRKSGQLPMTFTASTDKVGTLTLTVDPVHENTDPLWCTGPGGTAKIVVKSKALPPPPLPPQLGKITGMSLPDLSISPNDKVKVVVSGQGDKCRYHLRIKHNGGFFEDTLRGDTFGLNGGTVTFYVPLLVVNGAVKKGSHTASIVITDEDLASGNSCIVGTPAPQTVFTVSGKSGPITGVKVVKPKFAYNEPPQIMVSGKGVCGFRLFYQNVKTKEYAEFADYQVTSFGSVLTANWSHAKTRFDPGSYTAQVMKLPNDPNDCDVVQDASKTTAKFDVMPQPIELTALDIAPVKQVFAYGEKQDYHVKGAKIAKCFMLEAISVKKPGDSFLTGIKSDVKRTVAVPTDTVTDFMQPEGYYRVYLQAPDMLADGVTPNGCTGKTEFYFTVIPGLTRITGVKPPHSTVLAGQPIPFSVTGHNEGTGLGSGDCIHEVQLKKAVDDSVVATQGSLNKIPSSGNITAPATGNYYLFVRSAGAGDQSKCYGTARNDLVRVIEKIKCYAGGQTYDVGTEYGCYGYVPSDEYYSITCPDGYTDFRSPGQPDPHYGCRKNASPPAVITAATFATTGTLQQSAAAIAAAMPAVHPKIIGMGMVPGRSPDHKTVHTDQGLKLEVKGDVHNAAGYGVRCSYTITAVEQKTKKKVSSEFFTFDIHSLPVTEPGTYDITAASTAKEKSDGVDCLGSAEIKNVKVIKGAAVLVNFTLETWGHHIGMASDGGYPQFCENCNSVFSPAHDIGIVKTTPLFVEGPTCSYMITHVADGDSKSWLQIKETGKPLAPSAWDMQNIPFTNAYGADETKLKVTVQGVVSPLRPDLPPCEGSFTKSLTVYDDPSKPKQKK